MKVNNNKIPLKDGLNEKSKSLLKGKKKVKPTVQLVEVNSTNTKLTKSQEPGNVKTKVPLKNKKKKIVKSLATKNDNVAEVKDANRRETGNGAVDEKDNSDSDAGPEEVSISKVEVVPPVVIKEKTKKEKPKKVALPTSISYATGPPSESIPKENIIYVKNVPKKVPVSSIYEKLQRYGDITNIHRTKTDVDSEVSVAFGTEKAAASAIIFNDALRITNQVLPLVSNVFEGEKLAALKSRTVVLKNSDDFVDLISACGEVEYIYRHGNDKGKAFITFASQDGVANALKKHNTKLNNKYIPVHMLNEKPDAQKTIKLLNDSNCETLLPETVEKIFKDCGEIEKIDIYCSKALLAEVTFKDEKAKQEAMELNATTVEGIGLNIKEITSNKIEKTKKAKTTIFVSNIAEGTTEQEIRNFFEKTDDSKTIIKVSQFNNNAIIEFDSVDNFCQAFRLDEAVFKGLTLYIKPNYARNITQKRGGGNAFKPFGNNFHGQNRYENFKKNANGQKRFKIDVNKEEQE